MERGGGLGCGGQAPAGGRGAGVRGTRLRHLPESVCPYSFFRPTSC